MKNREYWNAKLIDNKKRLVEARKSDNDDLAKRLSQERQRIRRRILPRCEICDVTIQKGDRCHTHHKNRLMMKRSRTLRVIVTVLLLDFGGGSLVCPRPARVVGSPDKPPSIVRPNE